MGIAWAASEHPKCIGKEYKKGEWRKERNICVIMTERNTEYVGKIVLNCHIRTKEYDGHNLTTR